MSLEIVSHLDEEILPLPIALYVVGIFLKRTPKIPDWVIPWILFILSIISANLLIGLSISSSIQGILACGIAVLGNQLYKQTQIGLNKTKNNRKE